WWRSRYSCSCSALIESSPERTAETAGCEVMAPPFPVRRRSRVVGEQLPPAFGEDVDHPVELGPLAALSPAAGHVVELCEGQDAAHVPGGGVEAPGLGEPVLDVA